MSVLDTLDFQPMLITDVFESMTASKAWYDKAKLTLAGTVAYPFVSRTKASNGVDGFCSRQDKEPEPGNALTIGLDTQTIGYQPVPFYTSQNIQVLRHERLDERNAPVLASSLRGQMGKFSWGGNGATLGRLKATQIMVPVVADASGANVVDWDGIDRLGAELVDQVVTHTHSACATSLADDDTLPELRFEPMFITDVFESYRQAPAWLNTNQVSGGAPRYPHVTNTARGNSVASFIARQEQRPNRGNAITIGIDTQVVAYQPVPFYGATKVFELRNPSLNEDNALVLMASLRQAITKFSWGHKASSARLQATRIMVPVIADASGEDVVDWDGMTAYGHALRVRAERSLTPVLGDLP
ncbi:restriction endonuclease subunit S [Rothia kristinae]|uniref:Restriction endonuclease subunit S n=1 Tax=Rothia kristinae TaxID=37923 RepID=A0A7T4MV64_9MICC|nr:restriction endonuclease subunit S [Rothia kristinae]QQC60217.1 restriction endonuclease subunit S [Rothia kristinae]